MLPVEPREPRTARGARKRISGAEAERLLSVAEAGHGADCSSPAWGSLDTPTNKGQR